MSAPINIEFKVIPPAPISPLYITGNHAILGDWHPAAVALHPQTDGSWGTHLRIPKGTHLEYKITRGTWETQALHPEGGQRNYVQQVQQDQQILIHVAGWHDLDFQADPTIQGTLEYHHNFSGEGIPARTVLVWLPSSYGRQTHRRYPVLYMHDGQNLFDPNTAFLGVDWQVDESVERLHQAGRIRDMIVIGIHNSHARYDEYGDTATAQKYMSFLVQELKPWVDQNYRTLTGPLDTAVMGSSMGGLISFQCVWHYPEVFGQGACLSPLFWSKKHPIADVCPRVENHTGPKKPVRFYIDNGGLDLERWLMPGCQRMLRALQAKGWVLGDDLGWYHDPEAPHHESAWAERLWRPLCFLFGTE